MRNDTRSLVRRISNINSLTLINFYILDILLIRLSRRIINAAFADSGHLQDILSIGDYFTQYIIVTPLSILLLKFICDEKELGIKKVFRKPDCRPRELFRWIMMSLGLVYASSYLSSFMFIAIQWATKTEFNGINFAAHTTALGIFSNILAMAFLAPFFEELLFRGALLANGKRMGSWAAVFAVGISFGFWHGTYSQIIYASVMGTCAAFLVAKTGSIFSSLLLHFIINSIGALQSVFLGFLDYKELEKTLSEADFSYMKEHAGAAAGILIPSGVIMIIMIVGIVIFVKEIRHHKETFALPESHSDVSVKGKVGIYFTSPITVLAIIGALTKAVLLAMGKL